MTEQATETAARAQANGQAAAVPPADDCETCPTAAERGLGVLAIGFAVIIALMGIDMFTGGAISRLIPQRGTWSKVTGEQS